MFVTLSLGEIPSSRAARSELQTFQVSWFTLQKRNLTSPPSLPLFLLLPLVQYSSFQESNMKLRRILTSSLLFLMHKERTSPHSSCLPHHLHGATWLWNPRGPSGWLWKLLLAFPWFPCPRPPTPAPPGRFAVGSHTNRLSEQCPALVSVHLSSLHGSFLHLQCVIFHWEN